MRLRTLVPLCQRCWHIFAVVAGLSTGLWGGLVATAQQPPLVLPEEKVTGERPAPALVPEAPPSEAPLIPPAFSIKDSRSAPVTNAIGSAPSASEGRIDQLDLVNQPILRPGDVLERIPGLIVADHTGTTKANELFLRGFFLDHGTDFAVWIDDVPYNMPNHPHLHGYDDFNALIPELVQYIDFKKGVYYAEEGDFSSAGAARITMMDSLETGFFKTEVGKNSYYRELFANSSPLGQGTLLYAVDSTYFNGPWQFPENSKLFKGILRYTVGDDHDGMRVTLWGYSGVGRINDNIPEEAVQQGALDRFGTLDPFEGITTERLQINTQWWHKNDAGDVTKANLYYFYYGFSIFTNPSGDFMDPVNGDEFNQFMHSNTLGGSLEHSWMSSLSGRVRNTVGLQVRYDDVPEVGVNHTDARNLVVPLDVASVNESNIALYYTNEVKWSEKVRSVLAVRGDYFHWDVNDILPENSGKTEAKLVEPKGSLILGPWYKTEFYLDGGYGFHSNDARGIFNTLTPDFVMGPGAGGPSPNGQSNPIARSRGAETGLKTQAIPGLTTTLAFWYLRLDSELVFDPFGITSAPRGPSERYGIEVSNTYLLNGWLMVDADYSVSEAHFLDPELDPVSGLPDSHVDQAVNCVFAGGPSIRLPNGFFTSLHYKYLGPRYLTPDGTLLSKATNLVDLSIGIEKPRCTIGVDLLNLFNSNGHEIDFANTGSAVAGQIFPAGTTGHPLQPFQARFYCTLKF